MMRILCRLIKMSTILNIFPILEKHFETLKEDAKLFTIVTIFFIFPTIISFILVYCNILFYKTLLDSLIAVFAIFVGFMINILVMLINVTKEEVDIKNRLIKHLTYNVLYELILGIFILILVIVISLIPLFIKYNSILLYLLSFILYFLLFNFLLTLFMI